LTNPRLADEANLRARVRRRAARDTNHVLPVFPTAARIAAAAAGPNSGVGVGIQIEFEYAVGEFQLRASAADRPVGGGGVFGCS